MNEQLKLDHWGNGRIIVQELIFTISDYWRVLVIVPIIAGALGYLGASIIPGKYTSIAYLRIDRTTAQAAEALMTSPDVAEKVLADAAADSTPEARIAFLSQGMSLTDTDPRGDPKAKRIYRLNVTHTDAKQAQQIATRLINAWLEKTAPGAVERRSLEEEIERHRNAIDSISKLVDRLQIEANHLLAPNSLSGEVASPILALLTKRSDSIAHIASLERYLSGVSRDVVVSKPHLPQQTTWPRKGRVSFLSAIATFAIILVIILIARSLANFRERSPRPKHAAIPGR